MRQRGSSGGLTSWSSATTPSLPSTPSWRGFFSRPAQRVLVEASPVDRIWGIGLAADDERAADPARWPGLNLLGFALMEARAKLQEP